MGVPRYDDCGKGEQTINHNIEYVVDGPSRKFNQGFEGLHAVSPEETTCRITNLDISVYEPISQDRFTFNIRDF